MSLSSRSTRSRRARNSSTIAFNGAVGPRRAATPAFCANAVAQVIVCSWTFTICWYIGVGATSQPSRQPVIEHAVQGRARDVLALVQDLLVDLVAHDCEVVVRRQVREAAHLRPRVHRARG